MLHINRLQSFQSGPLTLKVSKSAQGLLKKLVHMYFNPSGALGIPAKNALAVTVSNRIDCPMQVYV